MIRKLTFNAANVTSNDDSVLYKALGAGDRILKGCTITNSENEIYIGAGYISVYGRQLKVEGTETVEVPAAVVATPYNLVLEIDMDNDTQEFKAITSEPVQDDISGGTGLYQMLIATFTMGTTEIEQLKIIIPRGDVDRILPSIFVKGGVQATDTVYATKGIEIIQGLWVTIDGVSGFLISNITELGTWNVHWTDGVAVREKSIKIDAVAMYTIDNIKRFYLYDEGEDYVEWESFGYVIASGFGAEAPTVTKYADYERIALITNSKSGIYRTKEAIDLTEFTTMNVEVLARGGSATATYGGFGIIDSAETARDKTKEPFNDGLNTLDISDVSNSHKVGFNLWAWSNTTSVTVSKIWLE